MEFTINKGDDSTPAEPPRRGRPPKSESGARPAGRPSNASRKTNQVSAALSTMESAYSALSMGALMLRRPLTAELIATQSEQWQASNRQAFEASPKLAGIVAGVGQTSGVAMFFVTNVVAAGSVVLALKQESAMLRDTPQETTPTDV